MIYNIFEPDDIIYNIHFVQPFIFVDTRHHLSRLQLMPCFTMNDRISTLIYSIYCYAFFVQSVLCCVINRCQRNVTGRQDVSLFIVYTHARHATTLGRVTY